MRWLNRVTNSPGDFTPVLDAYEYYTKEYEGAREFLKVDEMSINELARRIAGEMEHRYGQLQDVEAIVRYLEIREEKTKGIVRRQYTEHYDKTLTERQVERYSDSHEDVIAIMELRNTVALIRNQFLGLTKAYEMLHFQIGNIVRLRVAGMDDAMM